MPGLSGTGRLADDLYLMAHHEMSGKPLLQPRAVGLGLAGALLAELVLPGRIRIGPGGVTVADRASAEDGLASSVLRRVLGEPEQHAAQTWLLYLARTTAADVARRLAQSGYLIPARRGWRGERWVPVDADCAFVPVARVRSALNPSRPLDVQGAALGGLAVACGLGFRLTPCLPADAMSRLDAAVARLDPGLREVIAQTEAAVDSALLAHRV